MVMRDDALNGTHWDVYAYDPVSGRLASVTDTVPEPDVVHSFAWNPEGTLARWEQPNSYARVFGYDEEGRLVKIERDYGAGGVQVAYEYGYSSDGARVWKRDVRNGQEAAPRLGKPSSLPDSGYLVHLTAAGSNRR
jgi:hypothetical protein